MVSCIPSTACEALQHYYCVLTLYKCQLRVHEQFVLRYGNSRDSHGILFRNCPIGAKYAQRGQTHAPGTGHGFTSTYRLPRGVASSESKKMRWPYGYLPCYVPEVDSICIPAPLTSTPSAPAPPRSLLAPRRDKTFERPRPRRCAVAQHMCRPYHRGRRIRRSCPDRGMPRGRTAPRARRPQLAVAIAVGGRSRLAQLLRPLSVPARPPPFSR